MFSISYLIGKTLYGKNVCVSPRHGKFETMFTFGSEEEARNYYNSFDFKSRKLYMQRIKTFFCRHENECCLDVGSKIHHYIYCPDCNKAIYVNDETPKERSKRFNEAMRRFKKDEIRELEEEIIYKREELLKLKEKFDEEF